MTVDPWLEVYSELSNKNVDDLQEGAEEILARYGKLHTKETNTSPPAKARANAPGQIFEALRQKCNEENSVLRGSRVFTSYLDHIWSAVYTIRTDPESKTKQEFGGILNSVRNLERAHRDGKIQDKMYVKPMIKDLFLSFVRFEEDHPHRPHEKHNEEVLKETRLKSQEIINKLRSNLEKPWK